MVNEAFEARLKIAPKLREIIPTGGGGRTGTRYVVDDIDYW